jgi:hypothetical protein
VRAGRWIAGLNLDMVGADQRQTGSAWQLVSLPQAGAAFADHLLSWLREPFTEGVRVEETGFSGGSDHYILADPSVGIPASMLIQWPDTFYHTSADTPDKVSPESLARSGGLAAVYACWLATAGPAEARWLGHLMVNRFAAAAGKRAAATVEAARGADAPARAKAWADYHKASAFYVERLGVALGSLLRLDGDMAAEIAACRGQATKAVGREEDWVAATLGAGESAAELPAAEPWRSAAEKLIPRRRYPGPIDTNMVVQQTQNKELRLALWQLSDEGGAVFYDSTALAQYWADGCHTIADIADRVAYETGKHPGELALKYFKLLAETGMVEIEHKSHTA